MNKRARNKKNKGFKLLLQYGFARKKMRLKTGLLFFFTALIFFIVSCGTNQQLMKRVQTNELEIIEMKQSLNTLMVQVGDLENKYLLIKEKFDNRIMKSQNNENNLKVGSLPDLPVIHIGNKKKNDSINSNSKPIEIKSLNEDGDVIPYLKNNINENQTKHENMQNNAKIDYKFINGNNNEEKTKQTMLQQTNDPVSLYKQGYKLIKQGKNNAGRKILFSFLLKYGEHDLADNALYWIGESYYQAENLKESLKYFQRVIDEYPSGNKVPDALVKSALIFQKMNNFKMARYLFNQVITVYPASTAAIVAKKKLNELKNEK